MSMGKVTPSFQELYDWLKENRPNIFEWCKDQARWQHCQIGAIITWKEDAIRRMMEKPPKEET